MKTRSKIILLISSVIFGLIVAFVTVIYLFISRYSFTDFYKRLEIRSYTTARSELDSNSTGDLIRDFKGEYLEQLVNEKQYIIQLEKGKTRKELAEKYNLPAELLIEINKGSPGIYQNNNTFYSGIYYLADKDTPYLVITSAHNYYYEHHMNYLRSIIIFSVLVSIVIIVALSYWLSKRMINPIKNITQQVATIGSDKLYLRLEYQDQDDEMSELANTFNNMLDRLETSFETQSNFISNASHELNTPLTSIIGEADVTLTRIRSTEEYVEALNNILMEAEKLNKKTKALLFLAQTAFNGKALVFSLVRVDQLIIDVKETMNRIHPDNKVNIDFSMLPDNPLKLKISGNEQLLHLALSNIVLNAYKYSNNQPVTVSLGMSTDMLIIIVKDTGIGIPENEIKFIYDPFFRASNTTNFEGYGIGLPLTRNIIKIHNGELRVNSTVNKGTIIEIRLPKKFVEAT